MSKRRLLIVEDDASLRTLYETEFREEGYEVALAATGQDALERVAEHAPDVIVLDIHLPGRNGLEVLRALLERHPEIAVILNSAYPGYKADFACWSADGYVVKSSDLRELKGAVEASLERRNKAA